MGARSSLVVLACALLTACGSGAPSDAGMGGGAGGGSATCSGSQTRCGTVCVALATSNSNCGACARVCDTTSQCVNSTCFQNDCLGVDCADGQVCSDGTCLQRSCIGVTCGLGTQCVEGQCVTDTCGQTSCEPGRVCLSGQCTDVQCSGVVCGSGVCQLGRCVPGMTGGGGGSVGGGGGSTGGGGGSSTGGGGGSTFDAGTSDAGADAGSDAGTDAGSPDAGTDAGVDAGLAPSIIFSTTFGGTSITSTPNSQQIFGRIAQLPSTNSQVCTETVGMTSGLCAMPAAWLNLPGDGWSFDTQAQLWRRVIPLHYPPGQYRFFAKINLDGGMKTGPVPLDVTGPVMIFSSVVDGPALNDFVNNVPFYGRIKGLTASNGAVCFEPATATNCSSYLNWSALPTNGWTFDNAANVWRKTFAANSLSSGDYLHHARNTADLSEATEVPLLLTAP